MSGTARKYATTDRPAPPAGPRGGVAQPMKTFTALRPGPGRQADSAGDPLVRSTAEIFQVRDAGRGVLVRPNGTYNFVRVAGETKARGETLVSAKAGHAAIAGGRPVLYAGTVRFDNGALDWWSNYSGTYQPIAAFKGQAGLPEDRFQPWQKLQMGGVGMQRGTFLDRREPTAPTRPAADRNDGPAKPAAASAPAAAAAPKSGDARPGPALPAVTAAKASTPSAVLSAPTVPHVLPSAPRSAAPVQARLAGSGPPPPPIAWPARSRGGR